MTDLATTIRAAAVEIADAFTFDVSDPNGNANRIEWVEDKLLEHFGRLDVEAIRRTIPCPTCNGSHLVPSSSPPASPTTCLHCKRRITLHENDKWYHAGGWQSCRIGSPSTTIATPPIEGDPCPDCSDGFISPERAWAIVAAVFDDQPYDSDLPTEIVYLRAVRP